MNWKSFLEHLPKVGERILIIHEWGEYNFELHSTKTCYTIYECNFKSIKKYIVNFVNLKHIAGEKCNNFEKTQYISARALHWARLN
mgnify:FL=1